MYVHIYAVCTYIYTCIYILFEHYINTNSVQQAVVYRRGGVWGVQPPPEIPKALQKIVPNSTRL